MATEENTTEQQSSETTDQSSEQAGHFSIMGRPTPSERAMGRLMRAPDHGADDAPVADPTILGDPPVDPPADPPADDPPADPPADPADPPADAPPADPPPADPEANIFLGAPEGDYTIDTAALPEGTTIDKAALDILTPVAKEIGLNDAGVTKLAAAYTQILPNVVKQISDSIETDAAAQRKTWADETRTAVAEAKDAKGEPVYGGKTFDEVRAISAKALDRFGGPQLRPYLEETGLGNYEPLVRAFFNAGQAIKEDSFERGGGESAPKTRSEKYYGSTKGE